MTSFRTAIPLFLLLLFALLSSCSNQQRKQDATSPEQVIEPHTHPEVLPDLHLNNGEKWKVDEPTNKNVMHMQQTVELYEVEKNKTLAGYKEVGKELGTDINTLIENCRMTGPEHDALHEWLHPFMAEAESLSNAENIEEAEKYFEGVDAMLHKYYEYFQQ